MSHSRVLRFGASVVVSIATLAVPVAVTAQTDCGCNPRAGINDFGYRFHYHDQPASVASKAGGQDALTAIQEVTALLLADPSTDWSTVSIARLQQHLRDLDLLMVQAEVEEQSVEGGLDVVVRGEAPVLEAARRVLPAHLKLVNGFRGWEITGEAADSGEFHVALRTQAAAELPILRGMGFFGVLASGVYRPYQLLAIAQGRDGVEP